MENAVEALKMAGAAALFVLAFTIAMTMFTRARQTTDAVLDNLKLDDFFQKVEPLNNNTTREVGIETVIPTLYRYAQSDANIRIRILTTDGTEHQVFDQTLESDLTRAIQDASNTNKYYERLKKEYNDKSKPAYLFGSPWKDQNDSSYRIDRINAYIYGTKMKHMPDKVYYDTSINNGLLDLIKKAEQDNPGKKVVFEESYIEYNISGTVEKDEYGEEIVTKPASTKTIITYLLSIID